MGRWRERSIRRLEQRGCSMRSRAPRWSARACSSTARMGCRSRGEDGEPFGLLHCSFGFIHSDERAFRRFEKPNLEIRLIGQEWFGARFLSSSLKSKTSARCLWSESQVLRSHQKESDV